MYQGMKPDEIGNYWVTFWCLAAMILLYYNIPIMNTHNIGKWSKGGDIKNNFHFNV